MIKHISAALLFFFAIAPSCRPVWADSAAVPPCHPLLQCPEVEPLPAVFFHEFIELPRVEPFERTRALVFHQLGCIPAVTVTSSASELVPWVSHVNSAWFVVNAFSFGDMRIEGGVIATYWCPE